MTRREKILYNKIVKAAGEVSAIDKNSNPKQTIDERFISFHIQSAVYHLERAKHYFKLNSIKKEK